MNVSKSIVIVNGHPDTDPAHFCHALAAAYRRGAEAGGHTVTTVSVANLHFPMLRNPKNFANVPSPEELIPARDALLAADHLVLIYPLWLGTLPALTKGFLEQVFHKDTAFEPEDKRRWPRGRLIGKSARVIVTMGMPALVYRIWFGAHSLKSLERNLLKFLGFKPVRDTVFGMIEHVSLEKRQAWLRQIEGLGHAAR